VAEDKPKNPAVPDVSRETIAQSPESLAKAVEISIPAGTQQHPDAPKIAGYILVSRLGSGAFAQVWRAWQIRTRKQVAVKVFTQRSGVNWLFLQREVERLIRLDKHPHIVSLLDADLTGEPAYFAMDLMEGGSLDQFVGEGKQSAPARKVAKWMEEICEALSYVHGKGLIHCDLKPANVLLDEEGRVRVADFGQSRIVTESTGALGTIFYMAPEQAVTSDEAADVHPDVRWDIYGLGVTMWAVLTGKVPYGESEERLRTKASLKDRLQTYRDIIAAQPIVEARQVTCGTVDEDLSAIVSKCTSAREDSRYNAVSDVKEDLEARRSKRPVSPLAHYRSYRIKRLLQRNLVLFAVICSAFLLLTAAIWRLVEERATATRGQASAFARLGRTHVELGDYSSAAIYYSYSHFIHPSFIARANALYCLRHLSIPREVIHQGEGARIVAMSPDNRTILAVGGSGARLWDIKTSKPIGEVMAHKQRIESIAFSPTGQTVLTGSPDRVAKIWDTRTGKLIQTIRHDDINPNWSTSLAAIFSPNGEFALTASSVSVRLWDPNTGTAIGKPMWHDNLFGGVSFSPDSNKIISVNPRGSRRIWDTRTQKLVDSFPEEFTHRISAISPDCRTLLSVSDLDTANLWEFNSGKQILTVFRSVMRHQEKILATTFSPNSKSILTGSQDHSARLWDTETGAPVTIMQHQEEVPAVAFSPDGQTALTGGRVIRLWDARAEARLTRSVEHDFSGTIRHQVPATFSPNAKNVLTMYDNGIAQLWDTITGKPTGNLMQHESYITATAFSPDGSTMLTSDGNNTTRLWDTSTGKLLKTTPHKGITPHQREGLPEDLLRAISPDYRIGLTTTRRNTAQLWDLVADVPIGGVIQHTGFTDTNTFIRRSVFSPDARMVLTASHDHTARLWDARTGRPIGSVMQHDGPIGAATFSPDGRTVLTGSEDRTARLWDARTGRPVGNIMFHGEPSTNPIGVQSVAFSPDGNTVATATGDHSIRLWDAKTGEQLGEGLHHLGVWSIAFGPDSKTLWAATVYGRVQSMDIPWLTETDTPDHLLVRAEVASCKWIGAQGDTKVIPLDEWLGIYHRYMKSRKMPE